MTEKPAIKLPKGKKTRENVERVKLYLEDHPSCKLNHAAKILGLEAGTLRKWKERGYFEHINWYEGLKQEREEKKAEAIGQAQPVQGNQRKAGRPKKPHRSEDQEETSSGVVASPIMQNATLEELLEAGKSLKVSELRAIIKQRILVSIGDAKEVAAYAAALKQMATVQDVELEEVYEQAQLIRIYCPREDDPKELAILEVDPIDY